MKVLIACEFSGIVREEFKKRGHDAWSCDLLPTQISGQHIQDDVLKHLNEGWDLMIAHPPCTHLAVSGARWFKEKEKEQQEAIEFFMKLWNSKIPKIAIENPIGVISTKRMKPTQIIQPWMFGHETTKATCLWLYNLPKINPTKVVGHGERKYYASGKSSPIWHAKTGKGCGQKRSITFKGVAQAMAEQWG